MNDKRFIVNGLFDRITGRRKFFAVFFVFLLQGLFFSDLFAQNDVPFVSYNEGTLTFDYGDASKAVGTVYKSFNTGPSDPAWIKDNPNVTKVIFTKSFSQYEPVSVASWLRYCRNLTDENLVGLENLNTSKVDHFFFMFGECEKLTKIDVSHFDTSNALILEGMFNLCESLKSVDVSHFNTEKCAWFNKMFEGCASLETIDISSFRVSPLSYRMDVCSMFEGCKSLKQVFISDNFGWENVTKDNAKNVFHGCERLEGAIPYDESLYEGVDQCELGNYTTGYCQKKVGYQIGDKNEKKLVGAAGNPLRIVNLELLDKTKLVITDSEVATSMQASATSYSRDVTSDWGTLCLPFAVDVADEGNDCWFYPMEKIDLDKGRIPVTRMTEGVVEAGVPMFVKRKDSGQTAIHVVGKQTEGVVAMVSDPVNATSGNRLVGTFTAIAAPKDDNAYFIAKDKFRNVVQYTGKDNTKGVKVYGYRAYIMADGAVSGSKPALLGMFEDNGVTGMTSPENVETVGTDAECFDLQGCRTGGLRRGVNIVRTGSKVKKVIVR